MRYCAEYFTTTRSLWRVTCKKYFAGDWFFAAFRGDLGGRGTPEKVERSNTPLLSPLWVAIW